MDIDPFPSCPLICGNAFHHGLETTVDKALEWYNAQYPYYSDAMVNEEIKLIYSIEKVKKLIDYDTAIFELALNTSDFRGFVDLLQKNPDGSYGLYDFKYASPSSIPYYEDSGQLHVYKYILEHHYGMQISDMAFYIMPKVKIRQKKTEDIHQFRHRLKNELEKQHPVIMPIIYDESKVAAFDNLCNCILNEKEWPKNKTTLCNYCDYKYICEGKGDYSYMILPENKKVDISVGEAPIIWIYAPSKTGKTTFASEFPDVLILNTDGNVQYVDAPRVAIVDKVKKVGRGNEVTLAWEVFVEAIDEILANEHSFKTVVVDLVEEVLESCRLYMQKKMGVMHESDIAYSKGYDMVRLEFIPQLRRLTNSGYSVILLSHDKTTEVTKKSGEKLTFTMPNMSLSYANKLDGMMDVTGRIEVLDDGKHIFNFKSEKGYFGGGRLVFPETQVELDYKKFIDVFKKGRPAKSENRNVSTEYEEVQKENAPQPEEEKRGRG